MLVIISDLHLNDGTTGNTIGAGAFADFKDRLQELAFDASHRPGGTFQPIEQIELILLGDILDVIHSTRWTEQLEGEPGYIRPWHDPYDELYAQMVADITQAILENNEESFAILRDLNGSGMIEVPEAPDSQTTIPVKTNIYYLVGNHDWFYHLKDQPYDDIRQSISDAMGLANPFGPFPHDPPEADWLMTIYKAHGVFARHGDIYDPFNYDDDWEGYGGDPRRKRDRSTLGDAFVVDLLNRFPKEVEKRLGSQMPAQLVEGLDEIANIRPALLMPAWIDSLMKNLGLAESQRRQVKEIWDELSNHFLNLEFVREKDRWYALDEIDVVEGVLKLYDTVSLGTAAAVLRKIEDLIGGGENSFARHALQEKAYTSGWAKYIIYGHTHHFEIVPLNKIFTSEGSFDQIYFNSGTWHPIHELVKDDDDRFVFYHVMTYLAFFKEDERKGRPFETWSGSLGIRAE